MEFTTTKIPGVFVISLNRLTDDRGYFARAFCRAEFRARGLDFSPVQANISYNEKKGALRGLHYQAAPFGEAKLIRALKGCIFDVAVDIRPESSTYGKWAGVELSCDNKKALFLPPGCAHGFQSLVDDSEVFYLVDAPYEPLAGRGFRWDDPFFKIDWPITPPPVISEQDKTWGAYKND